MECGSATNLGIRHDEDSENKLRLTSGYSKCTTTQRRLRALIDAQDLQEKSQGMWISHNLGIEENLDSESKLKLTLRHEEGTSPKCTSKSPC